MDRLGWTLQASRLIEEYNSKIDGLVQYSDILSIREMSEQVYLELDELSRKLDTTRSIFDARFKDREY